MPFGVVGVPAYLLWEFRPVLAEGCDIGDRLCFESAAGGTPIQRRLRELGWCCCSSFLFLTCGHLPLMLFSVCICVFEQHDYCKFLANCGMIRRSCRRRPAIPLCFRIRGGRARPLSILAGHFVLGNHPAFPPSPEPRLTRGSVCLSGSCGRIVSKLRTLVDISFVSHKIRLI